MDTGVIADGLRRRGAHRAADDLDQRTLDGCRQVGGFPEFFRGEPEGTLRVNSEVVDTVIDGVPNRLEQPPQTNQGWTATRVWRILRRRGHISRHDPRLIRARIPTSVDPDRRCSSIRAEVFRQ